jgi:hypothetical protein
MSCYPDLTWPSCNPDASKNIFECSDPIVENQLQDCCLSAQTTNKSVSNCPAGFSSHPDQDEWCTDSQGIIHDTQYRHKCKRIVCDDSRYNPKTNCQTCLISKLKYPECQVCAENSELVAPNCTSCKNDQFAAPDCTSCKDPNQIVCGGVCVDPRYDENNCGGCAGTPGATVCETGQICDERQCKCGLKLDIVSRWAVFNPFAIVFAWTSPSDQGSVKLTWGDSPESLTNSKEFQIIVGSNTTLSNSVYTTHLLPDAPRVWPSYFTIELTVHGVTKSTTLWVDGDYRNDSFNCGKAQYKCPPGSRCQNSICTPTKAPRPDDFSISSNSIVPEITESGLLSGLKFKWVFYAPDDYFRNITLNFDAYYMMAFITYKATGGSKPVVLNNANTQLINEQSGEYQTTLSNFNIEDFGRGSYTLYITYFNDYTTRPQDFSTSKDVKLRIDSNSILPRATKSTVTNLAFAFVTTPTPVNLNDYTVNIILTPMSQSTPVVLTQRLDSTNTSYNSGVYQSNLSTNFSVGQYDLKLYVNGVFNDSESFRVDPGPDID